MLKKVTFGIDFVYKCMYYTHTYICIHVSHCYTCIRVYSFCWLFTDVRLYARTLLYKLYSDC